MGIAYNTSIVRDGLVLHLDAANVKSYPGSGTTWSDLTNAQLNGNLVSSPTHNSAESFSFDGVADYCTFGNNISISDTFSIEIVFKGSTSQTGTFGQLVGRGSNLNFGNYGIFGDTNNTYIRFGFNDNVLGQAEVNASAYSDLTTDSWVHYVGTFDSSRLRLYRNNSIIATSGVVSNSPSPNSSNHLSVGCRVYNNGSSSSNFVKTDISSVRIYNKALSIDEIKQNFEALRGRYGI